MIKKVIRIEEDRLQDRDRDVARRRAMAFAPSTYTASTSSAGGLRGAGVER